MPPLPRLQRGRLLARGLLAAWPLYETSGDVAHNVSGRAGLDGALVGVPAWSGGPNGAALSLSGSGQYANCGSAPSLTIPGAGPVTIMAWVNFTGNAAGHGTVAANVNSSNQTNWGLRTAAQNPGFDVFSFDGTNYSGCYTTFNFPGGWHHYAGLYTGSQWALYIDGEPVSVTPYNPSFGPANVAGTVGYIGNGEPTQTYSSFFQGKLFDVRLYSRALSVAELRSVYAGQG